MQRPSVQGEGRHAHLKKKKKKKKTEKSKNPTGHFGCRMKLIERGGGVALLLQDFIQDLIYSYWNKDRPDGFLSFFLMTPIVHGNICC